MVECLYIRSLTGINQIPWGTNFTSEEAVQLDDGRLVVLLSCTPASSSTNKAGMMPNDPNCWCNIESQ